MRYDKASWSFRLLAAILVVAPLFRAGVPSLPLMVLELLSMVLVVVIYASGKPLRLSRVENVAVVLAMLLPLVYLVPFPALVAGMFPGRDLYREAMLLADSQAATGLAALSVFPARTEYGWFVLLLPLAVFVATRSLDTERIRKLVILLFFIVGAEAFLGLLQFGAGDSPFYLGMEHADKHSAVGTYVSRNNFVGLLEMVLPISLALFVAKLGVRERIGTGRSTWRQRLLFISTMRGHKAFVYGAFSVLVLLAIVFSRSRAGIGLTMLGILCATLMYSNRIGGRNIYGITGTVVAIGIGFAINIGLAPVLDRFSTDNLGEGRWLIYSATLDGIGQFSPIGSGPGTFQTVFPMFQPLELGSFFVNRAHNDYLEWALEAGLPAMVLIGLFLWLYFRQWGRVWKKGHWQEFRYIQVGAGIGLLLMILHGLVDFNLHIPANMAFTAFLLAVFLHPFKEEAPVRRTRLQPKVDEQSLQPVRAKRRVPRPTETQVKNPFLD